MELNREQIKKELEGLANFRTCPEYIKNALALITSQEQRIKELTEDNERLRAEVSVKKKLLDKCGDLEDKVKADTVKKLSKKLINHFDECGAFTDMETEFIALEIDNVAEEFLRGR